MPLIVTTVVLIPLLVANARNVDLMRLGNDSAVGLGVATNRTRVIAIIAAVALIAVATAACGPIAFVAFVSGPIAARILGSGGSLIIPSAFIGGLIVLIADLIGQYFLGTRYPVGVVTGAFGAPFLIYLLIRSNRAGVTL